MEIIVGQDNSLAYTWSVTAGVGTLTVTGLVEWDLAQTNLVRVFDVTLAQMFYMNAKTTFSNAFVSGLPQFTWTLYNLPAGAATSDTLLVYLDLTPQQIEILLLENITGGGGGSAAWGSITGTLSAQTDLQAALNLKAPLASPTFTGTPIVPDEADGDNTGAAANTKFVQRALTNSTIYFDTEFGGARATGTPGTSADPLAILSLFNAQTTSYTLVITDKNVSINNASANTLTVPLNSSVAFPVGAMILVTSLGAGQTSIVATGGVTINSAGGVLKLRVQYSCATLIKTATNTWLLTGDITA